MCRTGRTAIAGQFSVESFGVTTRQHCWRAFLGSLPERPSQTINSAIIRRVARFGLIQLRFVHGAVRAVPGSGSDLVRQNYLPPPRLPNFGRSREGYGRYDFPVFSRIWVSTVDLGTQSSRAEVVDSSAFPAEGSSLERVLF